MKGSATDGTGLIGRESTGVFAGSDLSYVARWDVSVNTSSAYVRR